MKFLFLFHIGRELALVDKGQIEFFGRIAFALLLDPPGGGLEGTFADVVHNWARNGSLELDIAGVKDTCTVGLGRVGLQMPVARNIVKVTRLVVIESPGHAVLLGTILVVVKRGELQCGNEIADLIWPKKGQEQPFQ